MFKVYNEKTAPQDAQVEVQRSLKSFGFLPNLHGVLAEAPLAYKAYNDLFGSFSSESTFTPLERQVIFQTSNYENNCHYCVPGHSMIMTMSKMPENIIESLRNGTPLADSKLETLRTFTKLVLNKKGHLENKEIDAFLNSGYSHRQALEVLVGLASKLISNFTNALARTPIDEQVKSFAWTKPKG
jgi:alkylhydroperoxidase family enzyme